MSQVEFHAVWILLAENGCPSLAIELQRVIQLEVDVKGLD
jgi:hypothetical protein